MSTFSNLIVASIVCIFVSVPSGVEAVSLKLSDNYHVIWTLSEDRSEITFDVSVQTTGYIGFGLSNNGAMTKADIVIAGVRDGKGYLGDYHGPEEGNGNPILDKVNNYELLSAKENGTFTNVVFSRKTLTCDSEDVDITEAGLRIIWSYGSTDEVKQHGDGNRGAKSVYLLDPEVPIPDLSHFDTYDFRSTIKMPAKKTTYWCSIHKLPKMDEQHQMIAYDVILETPEARNFSHHMNVLKCNQGFNPDKLFGPWVGHEGVECGYGGDQGFSETNCVFLEYGWALGGDIAINPDEVGFSFESERYYMLEVHLNNPGLVENVTVEVGFRIYHTNETRPIEGSLLMVSGPTNYQLMVPPNSEEFVNSVHCMGTCTNYADWPKEGVTAYNAFLHAHTSARKMRLRHFRNGTELPWLIKDESYDFNYQTNRRFPTPVKILPGDQITLECVYDTNWKKGLSVIGGSSTDDEMCMAFIAYYPRIYNFAGCYDWMDKRNMFKILGIEKVSTKGKDPYVLEPLEMRDKKISKVIEEFNWTKEAREEYQWQQRYGPHVTVCLPRIQLLKGEYPEDLMEYVPESVCSRTNEDNSAGNQIKLPVITYLIVAVCAKLLF